MDDQNKPAAQEAAEKPVESNATGPKNINWPEVYKEYCTADEGGKFPSLRDLADKHGVALSTLAKKATDESWLQKRDETGTKAIQKFEEQKVAEISEANNRHLRRWRWAQNLVMQQIKDFEKRTQTWNDDKLTEKEKEKTRKPNENQLSTILTSLKLAIDGERIVLGLPTTVGKADIGIDRAKPLSPELIKEIDTLFGLDNEQRDNGVQPTKSN